MKRSVSLSPFFLGALLLVATGCGDTDDVFPSTGTGMPQGPYADLGDVQIYFEVHGSGVPLLMLHGGFSSSETWENQTPVLSQSFRVILMDSRGHGRSTDSDGPITYELLAYDAVRLLDHLGIRRSHVVGWSDGGVAGLHMGISFPERLDKLVTIGATAQGPGSLKFPYELMFKYEFLFNIAMDIRFKKAYLDSYPEPEWEVFRAKMFDLWTAECYFSPQPGEECMAPLAAVASEVLVMAGEREMIREEHTEAIHEHLPHSELLFIPGGTHFVMQEKPEEVNAAILDFLQ
jgi:pimeloyl-ACP methyl ester carboxylesterase